MACKSCARRSTPDGEICSSCIAIFDVLYPPRRDVEHRLRLVDYSNKQKYIYDTIYTPFNGNWAEYMNPILRHISFQLALDGTRIKGMK